LAKSSEIELRGVKELTVFLLKIFWKLRKYYPKSSIL
jgi:hypothetical protein